MVYKPTFTSLGGPILWGNGNFNASDSLRIICEFGKNIDESWFWRLNWPTYIRPDAKMNSICLWKRKSYAASDPFSPASDTFRNFSWIKVIRVDDSPWFCMILHDLNNKHGISISIISSSYENHVIISISIIIIIIIIIIIHNIYIYPYIQYIYIYNLIDPCNAYNVKIIFWVPGR